MTTEAARAQEVLSALRADIDNLDAILVYTLAQRFKATQAVGRLKAAHGLPPADPAREGARSSGCSGCPRTPSSTPNSPRNS
jgi:chorismate mutase